MPHANTPAPPRGPTPTERRRQALERLRRADEALRLRKHRDRSPQQQVELGLSGGGEPGTLAHAVALLTGHGSTKRPRSAAFRDALARLLRAAVAARSSLLADVHHVDALAALATCWEHWLRPPETWRPLTHNGRRQFAHLARHLLANYDVPAWMDAAWWCDDPLPRACRAWFRHVGRGENLRTAPELPFPLTKRMAHHAALAPPELWPGQALRWGQLVALGVPDRTARAAAATRLGERRQDDEPFWLTFAHFLAAHPMLDPHQVGPIVDYVFAQRFEPAGRVFENGQVRVVEGPPQPNFTMKGRTAESLLRQVNAWHRLLGRAQRGGEKLSWEPSGVPGFDRVEGEGAGARWFLARELLSSAEPFADGRAMRHCVGTYAWSCAQRRCAIFSLGCDAGDGHGVQRRATVEVTLASRTIVQARGRCNAAAGPVEQRVLRAWAAEAGLKLAKWL